MYLAKGPRGAESWGCAERSVSTNPVSSVTSQNGFQSVALKRVALCVTSRRCNEPPPSCSQRLVLTRALGSL